MLKNRTGQEQIDRSICAPSHVILVICQGDRIGSNDFVSSQRMINTTFQRFPDLYFIFVTNDKSTFVDMTKSITPPSHWIANTEKFNNLIFPEHFIIIPSSSHDPREFGDQLRKELRRIPKRIIVPFCRSDEKVLYWSRRNVIVRRDEFEDYVGPNQENVYRISPFYFRYSKHIAIQFQGVGYGDLTICQSRVLAAAPESCQSLKGMDTVWFNATRPCVDIFDCPSLYYSVSMDVSKLRCTGEKLYGVYARERQPLIILVLFSENDCRFPDQVRFILRHQGLACEEDPNDGAAFLNINVMLFVLCSALIYSLSY